MRSDMCEACASFFFYCSSYCLFETWAFHVCFCTRYLANRGRNGREGKIKWRMVLSRCEECEHAGEEFLWLPDVKLEKLKPERCFVASRRTQWWQYRDTVAVCVDLAYFSTSPLLICFTNFVPRSTKPP
ncbi:hypothetical protein K440DRAFT_284841 [Wilcoxina mikolae CBS 423.85]|nr:hypothetical protein K440DRAFT_284841 [Wilcoxina mikolae CBS 423.85]